MSNVPPVLPATPREKLGEFLARTAQRDLGQGIFELESPRMLEVNLNGRMNIKAGSMVAYVGHIQFRREGMLDQGVGNLLKKAVSGEGMRVTYAEGQGRLYLADQGKQVIVLNLQNESFVVNGNDVLAFETTLPHTITLMRKIAGMMSGGLFSVRFDGTGLLAITSHFEPLTLRVRPGQPVVTDPNATIAWTGGLTPQLKTDISLRTFLGRGSGESLQMLFDGDGYVVVQPLEESVHEETAG